MSGRFGVLEKANKAAKSATAGSEATTGDGDSDNDSEALSRDTSTAAISNTAYSYREPPVNPPTNHQGVNMCL